MDWDSPDRERPAQFFQIHEPWQKLSDAIVKVACNDYKAYKGRKRVTIEKFIRSKYFSTISNLDPDYLISNLQKLYPPRK